MKLSNVFIVLSSLFLAPSVVQGANIPLCSQQEQCLDFSTQVVAGPSSCYPGEPCVIKVCMEYTNLPGCPKAGAAISHMCDSGDGNGCLRTTGDLFDADGARSCSLDESGETDKCDGGSPGVVFCQEALPGDTVRFIAKDANTNSPDTYSNGGDGVTIPIISCDSAANVGVGNCGNVAAQLNPEMVWSFQIPSDPASVGCSTFCPAGTTLTKVDFSQDKDGSTVYNHGDYISDPGYGFSLSVQPGLGGKEVTLPRIYDSDVDGGADPDLELDMGNLLIIQEDNGANDDPDDNELGGKFFFNFDVPTKIKSIGLVDTEEPVLLTFFDATTVVGRVRADPIPNATSTTLDLDQSGIIKIKARFSGSGGIPFIELCVPN